MFGFDAFDVSFDLFCREFQVFFVLYASGEVLVMDLEVVLPIPSQLVRLIYDEVEDVVTLIVQVYLHHLLLLVRFHVE